MRELDIFDGHCDTLTACLLSGEGLLKNTGHLDLTRAMGYRRYAQFFALFGQPEDFPGQEISYGEIFAREHALFQRELAASGGAAVLCTTAAEAEAAFSAGKVAAFLSVEGAELLDSWFAGYYPAEDPRYTIVVFADSTHQTGESLAPVFARICNGIELLEE